MNEYVVEWMNEWMHHGGQSVRQSKSPEGSHRSL